MPRMHEPTVYTILQTQKGNTQVSRLLDALDELAGRLESVSVYEAGPKSAARTQASFGDRVTSTSSTGHGRRLGGQQQDFQNLQLPDPRAGPLLLFSGASEFEALQSAANLTSSQLHSKAERHAWRTWLMRPNHFARVVEAAWLLLSLLLKQDDTSTAALQAYVFDQLAHHYVAEVLAGQAVVGNAAGLWVQALAEAACILLRSAFPNVVELQDTQMQQLLHTQLQLWTTGLLPSDVGAQSLVAAASQVAGPADEECSEADVTQRLTEVRSGAKTGMARCTAPFVSVKPGPLVSAFMANRGLKPVALLHCSGPKLRRTTVPQQQLEQLQRTLDQHQLSVLQQQRQQLQQLNASDQQLGQCTTESEAATAPKQNVMCKSTMNTSSHSTKQDRAVVADDAATPAAAASGCSSRTAQAAACVAAAAAAAEQYTRSKKAGAAAASKSNSVLHGQVRQLQMKRSQLLTAGHDKVQTASNHIAGWLSESSGANTCVSATATDAKCKEQRQVMEGHLRLGDWRIAHTFNAAVHSKCLDMAAAVAVRPPPPAAHGPVNASSSSGGSAAAGGSSSGQKPDRPGGGWADIAGCSLVSNRLNSVKSGAGAGSSIKITKAARAIVEDVQRKFAAAPGSALMGK